MGTNSRARTIGFWVATGLVALGFLTGGVFDAARGPDVRAVMSHLGYPAYFAAILGVWKVLGGLAILAPRLPRLKEWAYAGMVFDLSGAVISHVVVGDGAKAVTTPAILLLLVVASWALRPASRRLLVAAPAGSLLAAERLAATA
jgi:uncharacterized membrane protein YphA (DoxX/SURF4 family)